MPALIGLFVLTGVLLVLSMKATLFANADEQIAATSAELIDDYESEGREVVLREIGVLSGSALANHLVAGAFEPDGTWLAGTITQQPPFWGIGRVVLSVRGGPVTEVFRVHVTRLSDLTIVVGQSFAKDLRAIRMLALYLLGAGILIFVANSWISMRLYAILGSHLQEVETTLRRFSQGQVDAKIALVGPPRDRISDLAVLVNRHLDDLRASIRAIERTSASISHDLRTPLTRASLMVQSVAGRPDVSAEAAELLDQASVNLERLSGLCDAILRIATIEASKSRAAFEDFDLGALIAEVCETYAPVLEDAGFALDWVAPDGALPLLGDRRMIGQVIVNLLTNVMAHCPAGTTAAVRAEAMDGRITLTVFDNGPGVPEADRNAIFEPFRKLDESRRKDGSGLGLALVRAVARHHDAGVTAFDAKPGLGITLSFAVLRP